MNPRLTASAALLLAALTVAACSTPAAEPLPPPVDVATTAAAPSSTSATAAGLTVTRPKRVDPILDCAKYLPALNRATGLRATVKAEESGAELCRYRLPYQGMSTAASVFFRAEPPGTPSYQPIGVLFGNTAYQVGSSEERDCGLSVALTDTKAPHEHGSHLTVLGSYEDVADPCEVTRRVTESIFDGLTDPEG